VGSGLALSNHERTCGTIYNGVEKVGVKFLLVIIFGVCTIIFVAGFHSEDSLLD